MNCFDFIKGYTLQKYSALIGSRLTELTDNIARKTFDKYGLMNIMEVIKT